MAYGRLPSFSRELTADEQAELDALIVKRDEADATLNASDEGKWSRMTHDASNWNSKRMR
ncbi:hypothetical protein B0G75_12087 [Paraburkholderia sp. BL18I3N2]|nr:hypothetical protein B0G75_12087 [Paraburkholderia sp. BL18I3N2]PRX95353.1 hypothetical protein B0G73_13346 [Paraburkholderia sp. BL25I1N1]